LTGRETETAQIVWFWCASAPKALTECVGTVEIVCGAIGWRRALPIICGHRVDLGQLIALDRPDLGGIGTARRRPGVAFGVASVLRGSVVPGPEGR
jgi:hypothetical protein